MPIARRWRILAAGTIVLLVSCGEEGGVERVDGAKPPLRHAIHSEELHRVMERMGQRVRRTWPQELEGIKAEEARRDEQARFRDAARLAAELAEAAESIPQAATRSELSEGDRQVFLAEVKKLRSQAEDLQARADARDRAGMEATLEGIKATCTNCHVQFREVAGPLQFGY